MVLDQLGCTELVGITPIDGRFLPRSGGRLEVGVDGIDWERGDDVGGDTDLGGDLFDMLPGLIEVFDYGHALCVELATEVGHESVMELDPLVGGLLGDDQ